jgi:integral membrane protein (TIGR01906 family)
MTKKYINLIKTAVFCVIALCIPILIISSSVNVFTQSVGMYESGFEKYKIGDVTGFSKIELSNVAVKMVDYFKGKIDSPQLTVNKHGELQPLYNVKELTHLEDVRNIVKLFQILQIISIMIFIILAISMCFIASMDELLKSIQVGAIISGAFTLILVIWALIDFQSLFILFHMISFTNNLWILDPTKDYLIMMFPEGFFNDVAISMVVSIIVVSIIVWFIAFILKRRVTTKTTKLQKINI